MRVVPADDKVAKKSNMTCIVCGHWSGNPPAKLTICRKLTGNSKKEKEISFEPIHYEKEINHLPIIFLTTSLVSFSDISLVISMYIITVLPMIITINPTPSNILFVVGFGHNLHCVLPPFLL